MNLIFRLLRILWMSWRAPQRGILEENVLRFRVWPTDCDVNLHMTNARYLSLMDLGRTHLIAQNGLMSPLIQERWGVVVHSSHVTYLRPLDPMQRFELRSRIVYWDEKYWYIEQRFLSDDALYAVALVRGLFLRGGHPLPTEEVARYVAGMEEPPPMPDTVRQWKRLLEAKKQASS